MAQMLRYIAATAVMLHKIKLLLKDCSNRLQLQLYTTFQLTCYLSCKRKPIRNIVLSSLSDMKNKSTFGFICFLENCFIEVWLFWCRIFHPCSNPFPQYGQWHKMLISFHMYVLHTLYPDLSFYRITIMTYFQL